MYTFKLVIEAIIYAIIGILLSKYFSVSGVHLIELLIGTALVVSILEIITKAIRN